MATHKTWAEVMDKENEPPSGEESGGDDKLIVDDGTDNLDNTDEKAKQTGLEKPKRPRGRPRKNTGKNDDVGKNDDLLPEVDDEAALAVTRDDDAYIKAMNEIIQLKIKLEESDAENVKLRNAAINQGTKLKMRDAEVARLTKINGDLLKLRDTLRERESELSTLKKTYDDLQNVYDELLGDNQKTVNDLSIKEEELEETKKLLTEKEKDYKDLLLEMIGKAASSPEKSLVKPKGLAIVDDIMSPMQHRLPNHISWEIKLKNNIAEITSSDIKGFDIVLLMTGAVAISQGTAGMELFSILKKIMMLDTQFAVLFLPPIDATQVSIFNLKVENYLPENVQILKWECRGTVRKELVHDGSLSDKCISHMTKALDGIQATATKSVEPSAPTRGSGRVGERINRLVTLPKGTIGRVIGRNGRNVKKITEKHGIRVSIGQWIEIKKEFRDETEWLKARCDVLHDAIAIEGDITKVNDAHSDIMDNLPTEPLPKKSKF